VSHTCEYFDCTLVPMETFVCDEHPASAAHAATSPAAHLMRMVDPPVR
jgi:hypothetical protein